MSIATVRLCMTNGQEVYFRASRREIKRMVVERHSRTPRSAGHVVNTEPNVPITIDLMTVQEIHIS